MIAHDASSEKRNCGFVQILDNGESVWSLAGSIMVELSFEDESRGSQDDNRIK